MMHNYNDPHSICNKFEDIFVYYDHVNPVQKHGMEFPSQLISLQNKTVTLDRGINIKFGEELNHCKMYKPVVFSPFGRGNRSLPTTDSKSILRTVTHNTGVRPLQRNELFAVVPPMSNCSDQYKIAGIIPLQTVSYIKYTAALNQFFDWIRGVNFLKTLTNGNSKVFSQALNLAYEQIKSNYLVQDMMDYISVPDGTQMTKVQTLYDIVTKHWIKPLFGHSGIIAEGIDIPAMIETSLRAINDTNPDYRTLFQMVDFDTLKGEIKEMFDLRMREMVRNVLNIPKYYSMLVQYMSPLQLPVAGTICVSYDDQYFVYPGKKMEVKQT